MVPAFESKSIQIMIYKTIKMFPSINNLLGKDDMQQIAWLAYDYCSKKFNPLLGMKFERFYNPRLVGMIRDELREMDFFSRTARQRDTNKELEMRHIYDTRYEPSACDTYDLGAIFPVELLKKLPVYQRKVIFLTYVKGLNRRQVGEIMGFSESRSSQLHSQAIKRLRIILDAKGIGLN